MSNKSKLQKSRDKWKKEATSRGNEVRYQKKENRRVKQRRDQYKKELAKTKKQLNHITNKNIVPVSNKVDVVYLGLQLFLTARIGFRAVSRVLHVMSDYLGLKKPPCTQTIINWVNRLSISRIQNIPQFSIPDKAATNATNGSICLIDASIGLGSGKILAVLFLDVQHHMLNQNAPTLKNIHCASVAVAESWTGESIAHYLKQVIAVTGQPCAYLKDGGADLAKAVRLLNEEGHASLCIDDISHVSANILRHKYQNHPMHDIFISACGKVSKKLKQTILACLAPPKVSTKARFMNVHRLLQWADKLLKLSPRGRASKNSLVSKLRASFDLLPECKFFIKSFLCDANALLDCQKILKTTGLNDDTYESCLRIIETLSPKSTVRLEFITWMDKQLNIAASLGLENKGMPVSSDNIETLFGVGKELGTGEIKDANRIALRIPSFCGELTREDATNVLNISVKEEQSVIKSLPSLTKQRRDTLPNPESLKHKTQLEAEKKNLMLIPGSIIRSKNDKNNVISIGYRYSLGPGESHRKQITKSPQLCDIEAAA